MDQKDYYQVLGVDQNTPQEKVKESYRRLAFRYHPDRNRGDPDAMERMKEINEAYAVLSDPKKRRDYDTLRERYGPHGYDRFRQTYTDQDIFRGTDINQVFEEMARAFGVRGFDEVFKESYGPGYRTFEFRRPGFFGRGFIFFGPGYRKSRSSEALDSSEVFPGYAGRLTRYLLKKMLGIKRAERGRDLQDTIELDPRQAEEGGKVRYGHAKRNRELMVTIPPGIMEGQKIRLKGMGVEGRDGGEPGDLYLKVRIRRPLLQRVRELLKI